MYFISKYYIVHNMYYKEYSKGFHESFVFIRKALPSTVRELFLS